ncbi:MAG: hypothetical protein RL441_436 [Actinomycetota bacterium]|jgi:[protein-PII] uridylyltransferase
MVDLAAVTESFRADKARLTARDVASTDEVRSQLVKLHNEWLDAIATAAGIDSARVALVAVGGFGRSELCAQSDLDLLLLHHPDEVPSVMASLADKIWYPIWDCGIALDHSVRDTAQARKLAGNDLKVVLGLLDARTVSGDDSLTQSLRASVLADWRAMAKDRLADLKETVDERRARLGDLSHLLEPDLKEAYGGLRDVTVLRAISASWLTDADHASASAAAEQLLTIRDGLHRITGRSTDRLSMHDQSEVAMLQGIGTDDDLLRNVFSAGRSIAVASDIAWHRVQRLTKKTSRLRRIGAARDERTPLADGVVVQSGEVVLAREAKPSEDPVLVLRAAAAAAQAGLPLAPHTVERLAAECPPLSRPWPQDARAALVSLLGAGTGAIQVWESLDQAGIVEKLLPHWDVIRAAPQRNALHIFTVDRHSLECAVQAARLTRNVSRPDLLLVGALFHDIGKARGEDHCGKGAALMQHIAPALGFSVGDTEVLVAMVQHHLLLAESATRRDLDDPATIEFVAESVKTHEVLDLLHNLTMADSLATGPQIWSDWKARLIESLVNRTHAMLEGDVVDSVSSLAQRFPWPIEKGNDSIHVTVDGGTAVVHIAVTDRVGLVEAVAGALSLQRLDVRTANLDTVDGVALQEWLVAPQFGDAPQPEIIRTEIALALSAIAQVEDRISRLRAVRPARRGFIPPPPRIRLLPHASQRSTVVEVRAHDAPALLFRVTAAVAHLGVSITSARVLTLGSEVVDVLYLQDVTAQPLSVTHADEAIAAISAALHEDTTPDQ